MRPFFVRISRNEVQYIKVNADDRGDASERARQWFFVNNGRPDETLKVEVIDPLAVEIREINPQDRGPSLTQIEKEKINVEQA